MSLLHKKQNSPVSISIISDINRESCNYEKNSFENDHNILTFHNIHTNTVNILGGAEYELKGITLKSSYFVFTV